MGECTVLPFFSLLIIRYEFSISFIEISIFLYRSDIIKDLFFNIQRFIMRKYTQIRIYCLEWIV